MRQWAGLTGVLLLLQVSGGTVDGLLAALREAGGCSAMAVLEGALQHLGRQHDSQAANQTRGE